MGIDRRPDEAVPGGDPGRTDSMILVSIDFDAHVASMVSIPRDGFVVIPEHGSDRVNAAYTYGEIAREGTGPELAKRLVASLFGVPIDRYALVDIHSMGQIIDTLGGVSIDVPERQVDPAYPTDDYRTIVVEIPARTTPRRRGTRRHCRLQCWRASGLWYSGSPAPGTNRTARLPNRDRTAPSVPRGSKLGPPLRKRPRQSRTRWGYPVTRWWSWMAPAEFKCDSAPMLDCPRASKPWQSHPMHDLRILASHSLCML
jgi:LCP family protein required for cell wall assembly